MAIAAPALAQDPLAPLPQGQQPPVKSPPVVTPNAPIIVPPTVAPPPVQVVQIPKDWRGVFDAIRAGQWASAQAGIATLPAGPLTPVAKAELYTARNSPRVELPQL